MSEILWEGKFPTSADLHALGSGRPLRVVRPDGRAPIVERDGEEIVPYSPSAYDLEDLDDAHDAVEALRWCCALLAERLSPTAEKRP